MGQNNPPLSLAALPSQIRIIVADPYPVIVRGVRTMIEDDSRFKVVAEASTMMSLRKKLTARRADVALVDWSMASEDLSALTTLLQCDLATTSLIFLTVSENTEQKQEMLGMGARGFLSKWTSARNIKKAILMACDDYQAHAGTRGIVDPTEGAAPVGANSRLDCIRQLTQRERQLLPLVCAGLKNKEIALHLGIAETTVWHHLTSIFTKLQVEDRLGLAAFAYHHQLISSKDSSAISVAKSTEVEGAVPGAPTQDMKRAKGRMAEPVRIRSINQPPASSWADEHKEQQRPTGS